MSSTIFCTFDQQDLADLAMGQIRQLSGVNYVGYVAGQHQNATNDNAYGYGLWGNLASSGMNISPLPSAPTSIKVICDTNVRKRVESLLINMHAYRIVSTS